MNGFTETDKASLLTIVAFCWYVVRVRAGIHVCLADIDRILSLELYSFGHIGL